MINLFKKINWKSVLIVILFSLIYVALLIGIYYFKKKDITNYNSDISNCSSDSLNTSFYVNNDGNLVSDNLLNVNTPWKENYILDGSSYWSNSNFNCYLLNLDANVYTISGIIYDSFLNVSTTSTTGIVIDTLIQTVSSDSFEFTLGGSTTVVICINKISMPTLMLNIGDSALNYEPFGVWYSETNYNNILSQVDYYNNYLNYGFINKIDYMQVVYNVPPYDTIVIDNVDEFNFDFLISHNFLNTGGLFVASSFNSSINNPDYQPLKFSFYFSDDNVSFNEIYFNIGSGSNFNIFFDFGEWSYTKPSSLQKNVITGQDFLDYATSFGYATNSKLIQIDLTFNSADDVKDFVFNSVSLNSYYQGYNDGSNSTNDNIFELKNTIDDLNNTIISKDITIKDLTYSLEQANLRAQNSLDHLTYSMIGAVMSTPFNILHDYLNWDFFGINLFSLFTSLVTLLLIIWIIKFLLGRK